MAAKPKSIRGREPDASFMDDLDTMLDELYADVDGVTSAEDVHDLLSDTHEDTVEATVVRGDIITGQLVSGSPFWKVLALGASGRFLKSDGTDVVYSQINETDIVDGTLLARVGSNETISGSWQFDSSPILGTGIFLRGGASAAGCRLIGLSASDVRVGDPSNNNNNTITFYTTISQRLQIANSAITASNIPFRTSSGTASAPDYSHATDTNSGMYLNNDDTVRFSCGGTLRIHFSTTQVVSTLQDAGPNGSAGTPTYSASADANTGIYFDGSDALLISTGGTLRWTINTNQVINTLGFVNSAVISPAALGAGATTDYAPTGFAAAYVLRLSGDAGGTSVLNSIAAPSAGREIVIINVSANNIGIAHDTGATAANRFYTPTGATITLGQYDSVRAWYDTTLSRWVVVSYAL